MIICYNQSNLNVIVYSTAQVTGVRAKSISSAHLFASEQLGSQCSTFFFIFLAHVFQIYERNCFDHKFCNINVPSFLNF